ncbi:MAG: thioredoxin [Clostridia bacterium]
MEIIKLTNENFKESIENATTPIIVDFWASWCQPCRMIAPVLEEINTELSGKVLIGKVNIDEEGELAMEYNVSSIPTLLIFKNGELINRSVGFTDKDSIINLLGL